VSLARLPLPLVTFALVVLARVPMLFALQDTHWPFEIFAGNVAAALLDGLDLDISRLFIIPHVRGGPLFGLLAVPLVWLFGSTEVVLKLVPLLWHAATAALLVGALLRIFGRRAAWCGLALSVCAPPLLAKLSVVGFATHGESSLVAVAGLLLAAPLLTDGEATARRWAGLGALVGFAGFFHLQALLALLALCGLVFLARPLAMLRAAPWMLVAGLACAAPSWLFESGNIDLLTIQSGGHTAFSELLATEAPTGEVTLFSVPDKVAALALEGLAPVLEFGDGLVSRKTGARLWWWTCMACAALALFGERRALFARPWLLAEGARMLVVYPALLAVALTAGWAVSGMELPLWTSAAGLESRRGALALWGMVMLAPVAGARGGRLGLALVGLLCVLGVLGQASFLIDAPERSGPNRGESYEQFIPHLEHHADRDVPTLLATLEQIDRGDRRFTSLRFRVPAMLAPARRPQQQAVAWARSADDQLERLLRLTHVGRALGASHDREAFGQLEDARWTAKLQPVELVALLHGVGIGTASVKQRPAARTALEKPEPWMVWLLFNLPAGWQVPVFEGIGFKLGAEHDPYLRLARIELGAYDQLPDAQAAAVYRGIGWGLRQRFAEPPSDGPGDERVLADIPEARHEAFHDGLFGRVLPREVKVLGDL